LANHFAGPAARQKSMTPAGVAAAEFLREGPCPIADSSFDEGFAAVGARRDAIEIER